MDLGWTISGILNGGGFYFDQGACPAIIDGSIKVKHGSLSKWVGAVMFDRIEASLTF